MSLSLGDDTTHEEKNRSDKKSCFLECLVALITAGKGIFSFHVNAIDKHETNCIHCDEHNQLGQGEPGWIYSQSVKDSLPNLEISVVIIDSALKSDYNWRGQEPQYG